MSQVRRAAVAGSWYPARADALAHEVDRYLTAVRQDPLAPTAIVAPHAGLMYSGPVAAHAYQLLQGRDIAVAVLVGPSHYVGFEGVAAVAQGAFETPLGPLPIAEEWTAAIARASGRIAFDSGPHIREHSLEMQLPFLKRVLPNVAIVPLVMGRQSRETAFELGDVIGTVMRGVSSVIVASTDLSHYQSARVAAHLDQQVIRQVEAFDDEALMALLEERPDHACGGGPLVAVMRAARHLGASAGRALRYADSGDVSGDKDAVVGYLAAAFGRFDGGSSRVA